jgi:hypothetical protein
VSPSEQGCGKEFTKSSSEKTAFLGKIAIWTDSDPEVPLKLKEFQETKTEKFFVTRSN